MNAYLNWGHWVADCASPVCASAARLEPRQGLVRCACQDDMVCDHPIPCDLIYTVAWPANVEAIEAVVRPRPRPNRNWLPGETIADLVRENLEHGVGV